MRVRPSLRRACRHLVEAQVQVQPGPPRHLTAAALRAALKEALLALHPRHPRLAWALLAAWGLVVPPPSSSRPGGGAPAAVGRPPH
jgi:hypothetical protein